MCRFEIGDRVIFTEKAIEDSLLLSNADWAEYTFEVVEVYPEEGRDGGPAYSLVFGNYDGEVPYLVEEYMLTDEYGN